MNKIKIINYLKKEVFQLSRSLGGKNNILTLVKIKKILKNLKLKKIKSGKKIFDWVVPEEWNIKNTKLQTLYYLIQLEKKGHCHLTDPY